MRIELLLAVCFLPLLFSSCAKDREIEDDNPYHVEKNNTTAHGEATVFYGHSAN